ncbi:DNA gyrase subunit A [Geobacillus phage GR1]|nr:DNA gyrase subunit A [Geobacillus phage GR1]
MTTTKQIENIVQDNMMSYSAYVLLDRALPDLRDGLKPVHRRILYTMYMEKAFRFTKSANISGSVMRIHPHGDSYGTMVGMVQKDRHSHPWLIGKGNFGNYTSRDLAPAASRYSEVKLSDISIDMMKDFEKNIVDFVDNYDGTIKIPEVLPVKFPAILAYAQSGIGVGFSSSTPSFNLSEICDAVIKYLKTNKKTTLVPDFATGGYIVKEPEIFEQINNEGTGTVKIRGKAEIEGNEILITEIPYSTTREAIIEKIVELAKNGKLKEVTDVKDLTGLKGMLITITARRGTDMKLLLEKLYRFTPLQSTYSSNMNILVNDLPRVLGVWNIIDEWLKWRRSSLQRSLTYDIKKMSERLHILRGLEKVLLDIDKAIDIIRKSKEDMIEKNLQNHFKIDEEQAKEVANMKLRNINKDYIIKKIKDIDELEKKIEDYKDLVGKEERLNGLIIEDLKETKEKYGRPRQTGIIELTNVKPIRLVQEVEVPDYPVKVHLTKEGYAYKFKNFEQEPFLKPGDKVIQVFEATNKSEVVMITDACMAYKIELSRLEESKNNSLGTYLMNIFDLENENVVNYTIYDDKRKFLIIAYKNNRIAKVDMKVFSGRRKVLKYGYKEGQEVVDMITLDKEVTLKLKTTRTEVKINTKDLTMISSRATPGTYATRRGELEKVEVV